MQFFVVGFFVLILNKHIVDKSSQHQVYSRFSHHNPLCIAKTRKRVLPDATVHICIHPFVIRSPIFSDLRHRKCKYLSKLRNFFSNAMRTKAMAECEVVKVVEMHVCTFGDGSHQLSYIFGRRRRRKWNKKKSLYVLFFGFPFALCFFHKPRARHNTLYGSWLVWLRR